VRTHGVAGVKVFTYEVTFTDGVRTNTRLVRTVIAKHPVTRVIAVGTKPRSTDVIAVDRLLGYAE
jgi:uncharacterized protein YabE (DUF348 family)